MTKNFKGYSLVEKRDLPDIRSVGYLYKHDKTGAEVLYLENEDDNKAFNIAFRTPPYNDNGIAHIIEHSVLNGSKKYPSKEPFVELLKGSLNTFLNAMTYSDKTVYPVSSRNQKDFNNLMSVYLDAVFYPNFKHDPQILMQEGWHYHLENADDELIYKGVVYNEMRGAFSQADSELYRLFEPTLFPDTVYKHISGGMPAAIPSLTQEEFVAFHDKYYHPSNARVTLYGNLDLDTAFAQLTEYFDAFDAKDYEFESVEQDPFSERHELEAKFSISKDEPTENKSLLAYIWAAGKGTNSEELIALGVLDELLLGSNTAPIKKALLKSGLGSDVSGGFGAATYSPIFEIVLKDTNPEAKDQFVSIIENELKRLVAEGIPQKAIQAALNKAAFRYKELTALEGATPKGILYSLNSLTSWLYGGDVFATFEYQRVLDKMQEEMANGYFERLIQTTLLNNTHAAVITLAPEPGLGDRKDEALKEELAAYKASLSDEEVAALVEQTQQLLERQTTPDKEEDLAKLPKLSIEDIDREVKPLPLTVEAEEGKPTFLHYEDFTAGISYVKYYFNLSGVKTEDIPVVAFLTEVLGEVGTENFTDEALSTEIDFYTGGIGTNATVITESVADNIYYPKFTVSGKALSEYQPQLLSLIEEIVHRSNLDDVEKIKELLLNVKADLEMNFNYGSHVAALRRLESYYYEGAKYLQSLEGIDYYDFICDVVAGFDANPQAFIDRLKAVLETILTTDQLVATFVGSKVDFDHFKQVSEDFFKHLGTHKVEKQAFTNPVEVLNEGFKTAQEINYVAKGYNQTLLGVPVNGMNLFLKSVLGLDYLWNTVRVQGGAYGGMSVITDKGDVAGLSYRDPNIVETLERYDGQVEYLENFNLSEAEFEKNLIGTFSTIDRPLSAAQKGAVAFTRYFTHLTQEKVQQFRDEILAVTPEKVRAYAPTMKAIMDQNAFVVIGNDTKIENHKDIFKNIRNLTK